MDWWTVCPVLCWPNPVLFLSRKGIPWGVSASVSRATELNTKVRGLHAWPLRPRAAGKTQLSLPDETELGDRHAQSCARPVVVVERSESHDPPIPRRAPRALSPSCCQVPRHTKLSAIEIDCMAWLLFSLSSLSCLFPLSRYPGGGEAQHLARERGKATRAST